MYFGIRISQILLRTAQVSFVVALLGCEATEQKKGIAIAPQRDIVTGRDFGASQGYPLEWWESLPEGTKESWEIGPDEAKPGEVILSKRTELGILSNFAETPFVMDGKSYASLEGFWQATKFPDPELPQDVRFELPGWPTTRAAVEKMVGREAKKAGSAASKILEANQIDWVSYRGIAMTYREPGEGLFYQLIRRAMIEKAKQNLKVREVLIRTKNLRLKPDHDQGPNPPKAWLYHEIWMEIRSTILNGGEI